MIVNETETRNFSAVSAVDVQSGTGKAVVYMNANYDKNSGLNFQKSIRDVAAYKENKETCDADFETFQRNVESAIFG